MGSLHIFLLFSPCHLTFRFCLYPRPHGKGLWREEESVVCELRLEASVFTPEPSRPGAGGARGGWRRSGDGGACSGPGIDPSPGSR